MAQSTRLRTASRCRSLFRRSAESDWEGEAVFGLIELGAHCWAGLLETLGGELLLGAVGIGWVGEGVWDAALSCTTLRESQHTAHTAAPVVSLAQVLQEGAALVHSVKLGNR